VPNNEDGFLIERCSGKGKCTIFVQIAQTGADGNGFSQTGLNPMTAYIYRVRAFNSAGNSGFSNTAKDRTPK